MSTISSLGVILADELRHDVLQAPDRGCEVRHDGAEVPLLLGSLVLLCRLDLLGLGLGNLALARDLGLGDVLDRRAVDNLV